MDFRDRFLLRKLAVVLVIKLVFLMGLWWGFVREQRVVVDTDAAASQMLGSRPMPHVTTQE
ncbi:hypothetical protein D9M68_719010 [compost metagenome]|nr:hypothetical protein [Hydrogenophaga sp.]PKO29253.1 MAG: hypothetical protein CVU36_13630 [Betaproteobacteria bacterium HGW-Betaproteobacteria-9]